MMQPQRHPFPRTSAWRRTAVGALLAMTVLVAAACGGSKATSSSLPAAGSSNSTVAAASSSLGDILVTSDGTTLYLFAKDSGGKSSCTGACAKSWPPYAPKGALHAGSGVKASLLHAITRPDGTRQLVYNGHPLYTFGGDAKPGDVTGQASDAFGAKWYAVSPSGAALEKAASSSGKGYGY